MNVLWRRRRRGSCRRRRGGPSARAPRNVAATSGRPVRRRGLRAQSSAAASCGRTPLVARERDRFVQELERAGVVAEAGAEAAGERHDAARAAGNVRELAVQVDVLLGGGERGGGVVALECPGRGCGRRAAITTRCPTGARARGPVRRRRVPARTVRPWPRSWRWKPRRCGLGVGIVDGVELRRGCRRRSRGQRAWLPAAISKITAAMYGENGFSVATTMPSRNACLREFQRSRSSAPGSTRE